MNIDSGTGDGEGNGGDNDVPNSSRRAEVEDTDEDIKVQRRNIWLYQGKKATTTEEEAEMDGEIMHEEVRKPVTMRVPRQPTKEEVNTQNITHALFR